MSPTVFLIIAGVLLLALIGLAIWLTVDWLKDRRKKKRARKAAAAPVPTPLPPAPVEPELVSESPKESHVVVTERLAKGSMVIWRCNYVITDGLERSICPFEVLYLINAEAVVNMDTPPAVLAHLGRHAR